MGTELSKQTEEDEYYILGFRSLQGQWGNIHLKKKFTVDEAKSDGFENWINSKGVERAFIDFKGLNYSLTWGRGWLSPNS